MERSIRRALISVYHKDGLEEILAELNAVGVDFVSTGGTLSFIKSLGYNCVSVESLTSYPEMLGGRVKTLHPRVFGGILARRDEPNDMHQIDEHEIPAIDLVIVDLYPFQETVSKSGTPEEIIEKIDIGGISLIRAAAKNYRDVVVVGSQDQYPPLLNLLRANQGKSTLAERRWFAREAFAISSGYDTAIFNYFDAEEKSHLRIAVDPVRVLRYGENPHQRGLFFGDIQSRFDKLQGKDLSYNNLQDVTAGIELLYDFPAPSFAILKHNNACGIASRGSILEAWHAALESDPVSAFGGVLVANRSIDEATAVEINKIFFEVIVAPDYDAKAIEYLSQNSKRIILVAKDAPRSEWQFRSSLGGVLAQETDCAVETADNLRQVTLLAPTDDEIDDLIFANKVVKHCKSNAITIVKDSQLYASGVGQTSRVDALRQAISKAKSFGFDLHGAVMASDAFFPFPDCVEIAAEEGITAIVQPGGSIKDEASIEAADRLGVSMVMTGVRHFKH